ncbi:calcium-binding protein, partial [Tateyamaria sp.]|uniref:calcium-binding protein n=1 Tax=Tateyamaria sp. TaxID=1929288 RepID=UPI00329E79E5
MTKFTLFGNNSGFFGDGFFGNDGEVSPDLISNTPTKFVVNNPDTGITTTLLGTNFALGNDGDPSSGTITSISMSSNNGTVLEGTVTDINWGFVDFVVALDDISFDGNFQPLANLLNGDGPITIDGSNAPNGLIMFELLPPELTGLVTQPITVLGSSQFDNLYGGIGNDSIVVGADSGGFDGGNIEATLGNDTIDFSNVSDTNFQFFDYAAFVDGAVTFNLDAVANTGTITGAGFTTTLIDVRRIMEADGIGFGASEINDVFNIVNTDDGWFNLFGGQGNDTFNVEIGGGGRISFNEGAGSSPFFGLIADLSTGIVSNDGFGGQDTINVTGDGRLEIRATDNNDSIIGSDRNESFITEQGNDTVDGGAGQDRVRYDRSGVDAVNVDLAAQTASGTWDGVAFTDTLISIEYVRGSREGDDTLSGAASDDRFEGRGGNDLIDGRAGNDTLEGGDGNDTLQGGLGDDDYFGDDG